MKVYGAAAMFVILNSDEIWWRLRINLGFWETAYLTLP